MIAELIVLSGFVVAGSVEFILCAMLLVAAARLRCGNVRLAAAALWRLKWFFIAVGLLAWLSSPGFPANWHFAARACAALATLVLAVDCFHQTCSDNEKLAALLWWLSPLKRVGVPVERFAARLWLTLRLIPQQQQALQQALQTEDKMSALRQLLQDDVPEGGMRLADGTKIEPGTVIALPRFRMHALHWCRPALLALLLSQLWLHLA